MWTNEDGEFVRPDSKFREHCAPEAGRYHLYVSLACPWAHRTLIVRRLRRLEDVISVSIVDPVWDETGWYFSDYPGSIPDFVNHKKSLIDIYRMADEKYQDEETTPVLWDKKESKIVNNESAEIIRMFDVEFAHLGDTTVNLYPLDKAEQIDATIKALYRPVNNGVYRAGFARTQRHYERAVNELFEALDLWESVLGTQRFLCGDVLTEADVCFYTTLVRLDAVYYTHFKCNIRRIIDYKNLWRYLRELYVTKGFGDTTNFDHIKRHYFVCHREINPTGIIPVGPELKFPSLSKKETDENAA